MSRFSIFLVSFLLLLLPFFCYAKALNSEVITIPERTLIIQPNNVVFKGEQKFQDILIYNLSDTDSYFKTSLYRIKNPSVPLDQGETQTNDPMAFGLVLSPTMLKIYPKGMAKLRIRRLAFYNDKELYYRIFITPEKGKITWVKRKINGVDTAIAVVVRYQINVRLLPSIEKIKFSKKSMGNKVELKNDSNISLNLLQYKTCESKSKCMEHRLDVSLYPGETKRLGVSAKQLKSVSIIRDKKTIEITDLSQATEH